MKKFALGSALAVLALSMPTTAPAQRVAAASVVVVDTDRISRECTACRAAQTQLQTQITAFQQRQQALATPIQTEAQAIETAAQAARSQQGAARTTAETGLQARVQALQARQNTANQELQRLEQNLRSTQQHVMQQIGTRLRPIINQVMTARGANLAVDVGATMAHAAALDVTNEVLAALNQQLPSVSVTPLPAQAGQQPAQRPQPQGR